MEPIDDQSRPALAAGVRLQTNATTGESVLLYPEGLMNLNPTAFEVVSRCDGKLSVAEIVAALAAEYDADADTLRGDVVESLTELRARKLVLLRK